MASSKSCWWLSLKPLGTLEIRISFEGNDENGRGPQLPKQAWLLLSQKRLVEQFVKILAVDITMQKHYVLLQNAVAENNKNTFFSFSGDRPRGRVRGSSNQPHPSYGVSKI